MSAILIAKLKDFVKPFFAIPDAMPFKIKFFHKNCSNLLSGADVLSINGYADIRHSSVETLKLLSGMKLCQISQGWLKYWQLCCSL